MSVSCIRTATPDSDMINDHFSEHRENPKAPDQCSSSYSCINQLIDRSLVQVTREDDDVHSVMNNCTDRKCADGGTAVGGGVGVWGEGGSDCQSRGGGQLEQGIMGRNPKNRKGWKVSASTGRPPVSHASRQAQHPCSRVQM